MIDNHPKTNEEILQTTEDYQMEIEELEVYSIKDAIKTDTQKFEAPYKELEQMFDVKVFE